MHQKKEKILVTGAAGFIGYHFVKKILRYNYKIIGIDNLNNYYDVKIKNGRLRDLKSENFLFIKQDLKNKNKVIKIFKKYKPNHVFHFAAQAGVRNSFIEPDKYFDNNLKATYNVLEASKIIKLSNLFIASTSSVYGQSKKKKFNENDEITRPIQLYAATKSSCEVLAYSQAINYKINTIIFRFFTVYGPWGRPDMALFKFVKSILEGKKIQVFNRGDHKRDFTYVEDLVTCMFKIFLNRKKKKNKSTYEVYNIGAGNQQPLKKYINLIEFYLKKKSKQKLLPLQRGDIKNTFADNTKLRKIIGKYKFVPISIGIKKFIKWYREFYNL